VRTLELMHGMGGDYRHWVVARDGHISAAARIEGATVEMLASPRRSSFLHSALAFRSMVKELRPDLVLTYNWGAIEATWGASMAGGFPVIHAEDGFGNDEATGRKFRRVWARRFILPRTAKVVVPSRTLFDIARDEFRVPESKLLYIPNGVDTGRFRPRPGGEVREQLGIARDAFVVGNVGHLRGEKNVGLLVSAFASLRVPEARLLVAGEGPMLAALRQQAEAEGCADRILWLGAVNDPAPLYAAIDVLALSSNTEQMPLALLEAMACGLPVVATDVGDCREMLGEAAESQVVPARDETAFSRALERFAGDGDERRRTGERNRSRCSAHYSLETMIERYRSLYDETALPA